MIVLTGNSFGAFRTAWKVSKYGVFLCIFPHSDWIWRDTPCLSVFNPNVEKYGPEQIPYLDTFHSVSFGHVKYVPK